MDFEKVKEYVLTRMKTELPQDLFYHKMQHSLDVLAAVERIAAAENTDKNQTVLLKTAAILHDSGFMVQYHSNEPFGCDIAREILPQCGYENADIETICNMIMATALPQSPKNKLDKILCDADLDYLGRKDFYSIAEALRRELKMHGTSFTDKEWLHFEIDFLEKHRFFTETSRQIREPQKQLYLRKLKDAMAEL